MTSSDRATESAVEGLRLPPVECGGGPLGQNKASIGLATSRERNLCVQVTSDEAQRGLRRRLFIAIGRATLICGLLFLWGYSSGRWIDRQAISDPITVLEVLWSLVATGRLWQNVLQTVVEVSSGYACGSTTALLLAVVFALAPAAQQVVRPYLIALYSIPMIALAPLFIMWFGLGTAPKVIISATFVFFVVFMNAAAGVESVNPQHINIVRVMGAGRGAILGKIVLPTTVPFAITGLRLAIPEAVSGAIIGEFIASNRGLGYLVKSASAQFNVAVALAAIVALLVIVAVADRLLEAVDRHLLRWRPSAVGALSGVR